MQCLTPLVVHRIMSLLPYPMLLSFLACSKRLSFANLNERKRAYILSTLCIRQEVITGTISHDLPDEAILLLGRSVFHIDGICHFSSKALNEFRERWPDIPIEISKYRFFITLPFMIQKEYGGRCSATTSYRIHDSELVIKGPSRKDLEDGYVFLFPQLKIL